MRQWFGNLAAGAAVGAIAYALTDGSLSTFQIVLIVLIFFGAVEWFRDLKGRVRKIEEDVRVLRSRD